MNSGSNQRLNNSPLLLEPSSFDTLLTVQQDYALFLDIDGTLAEFTLDPKDTVIPKTTLMLLQQIQACGVPIAVVTGRSLSEARQLLSPLDLPIAATHGLEMAFNNTQHVGHDENLNSAINSDIDISELTAIKQAVIRACQSQEDLLIEDKPYSIALHYRQHPKQADLAFSIMNETVKNYPHWRLKQGKYVWEIVPKGADKGLAILTLLERMQADNELCAIFIGDDVTDEAGFSVVQSSYNMSQNISTDHEALDNFDRPITGMGIKVGYEPSIAHYYVPDISAVSSLLECFLCHCQKRIGLASHPKDNPQRELAKTTRGFR